MVKKYLPLQKHLVEQNKNTITITLNEIEEMVGKLPTGARTHQFWATTKHHKSTRDAWLAENYEASLIDNKTAVRFEYVGQPESLRSSIQEIVDGWPRYKEATVNNHSNNSWKSVADKFLSLLKKWEFSEHPYIYLSSAAQENNSDTLWIAILDPQLTKTSQNGCYPVYLFSKDLSKIYLSFSLGVKQFGENKEDLDRIKAGAERMRNSCQSLERPDGLHQTNINLDSTNKSTKYKCYEAATILAYSAYDTQNLPSDVALKDDFLGIMKFYHRVANDAVVPDLNDIIGSVTPIEETTEIKPYKEFVPRPKAKTRKSSSNENTLKRRSKESRKIGNTGEIFVLHEEKRRLTNAGRKDLADRVDHLAARHETPGWDITSFDEDGNEIYIEVKSSKGNTINSVELTKNEWEACSDKFRSKQYYIYLVTNALSSNRAIEVISNPDKRVTSNELQITPSAFELSLRTLK